MTNRRLISISSQSYRLVVVNALTKVVHFWWLEWNILSAEVKSVNSHVDIRLLVLELP